MVPNACRQTYVLDSTFGSFIHLIPSFISFPHPIDPSPISSHTLCIHYGSHVCHVSFSRYIDPDLADDELKEGMNPDEPVYLQKLHEISITGSPYLPINCKHLKDFDADLNRQLISYPQVECLTSRDEIKLIDQRDNFVSVIW